MLEGQEEPGTALRASVGQVWGGVEEAGRSAREADRARQGPDRERSREREGPGMER